MQIACWPLAGASLACPVLTMSSLKSLASDISGWRLLVTPPGPGEDGLIGFSQGSICTIWTLTDVSCRRFLVFPGLAQLERMMTL